MVTLVSNSKDTPSTIRTRIIGAAPVVDSTCRLRVDELDGTVIVGERLVTDTIVVNSITYFEVRLTLTEADLLLSGVYLYTIQVESISLNVRQEEKYTLQVSEQYVTG
jgi:hypothetical protein